LVLGRRRALVVAERRLVALRGKLQGHPMQNAELVEVVDVFLLLLEDGKR
jgi:hypothetical protein